ncbi:MAG: lipoprotein [Hyphomicrobiales bacterium]|nr:lipoprotein [Hyphomicrobiales bacterium]
MRRSGLHFALALLLATAMGLGACGRQGPLERPPNAPKSQADASASETANPDSDRPQRRFVLDRLIQ